MFTLQEYYLLHEGLTSGTFFPGKEEYKDIHDRLKGKLDSVIQSSVVKVAPSLVASQPGAPKSHFVRIFETERELVGDIFFLAGQSEKRSVLVILPSQDLLAFYNQAVTRELKHLGGTTSIRMGQSFKITFLSGLAVDLIHVPPQSTSIMVGRLYEQIFIFNQAYGQ